MEAREGAILCNEHLFGNFVCIRMYFDTLRTYLYAEYARMFNKIRTEYVRTAVFGN